MRLRRDSLRASEGLRLEYVFLTLICILTNGDDASGLEVKDDGTVWGKIVFA